MGHSDLRSFVCSGIASCVAEFGTFPIDTTKTRLQIQGQHNSPYAELRYRGMLHAFGEITRLEGFRALYAGIAPALLRQAVYGTIKFGTYDTLKRVVAQSKVLEGWGNLTNVMCAVVAGLVSSAIANPTDVLKVRMQVQGHHHSLGRCIQDVHRLEGVSGFWRGVVPTSQRAVIIAAVELPVYDFCKLHLMPILEHPTANHTASSFIASLGAVIASTPFDVIRTRLMNQRKFKTGGTSAVQFSSHLYKGCLDCLIQTVRNEGVKALYKGFIPSWLRMGPWNIIFFNTFEQLKELY